MKHNSKKWWLTATVTCSATLLFVPAVVCADEPQDKKDRPAEVRGDGDQPRRDRERGDRERGDRPEAGQGAGDERRGNPIMMVRMMMQRFDKDGDDKLDREELAAALTEMRQAGGPGAMFGGAGGPGFGGPGSGGPGTGPGRYFDQLDADKDGKLTGSEIPERLRQGMERIDTNGDGAIAKEELQAMAERFGGRRPGGDQPRDGQSEEGNRLPKRPDAE